MPDPKLQTFEASNSLPSHFIHPEYRSILGKIEEFTRLAPPLSCATLHDVRHREFPFLHQRTDTVAVEHHQIGHKNGDHLTGIYVVNAEAGCSRPAILHMHGGGFVAGKAGDAVGWLQQLAIELDCVIISVDYRLAPEACWNLSLEDNYTGLKWLYDNAAPLGVDRNRIAVLGDSAGGGHAALVAIAARDRGEVPLVCQCLIYPMLDDRTGSLRQLPAHVGSLIWTAENNLFGWRSFLGVEPGTDAVPDQAVPARLDDYAGLPPAFIGVGSLDLFADENISYAQRLNQAGVATELIVVPGVFHGFDLIAPQTIVSQWFQTAIINALRRSFEQSQLE